MFSVDNTLSVTLSKILRSLLIIDKLDFFTERLNELLRTVN